MKERKIGLFVPCFVNELYPRIASATLHLLEDLGYEVIYPMEQTCCGQPMANAGCSREVKTLAHRFVETFKPFDYIVAPTASCVTMVKEQYETFFAADDSDFQKVKSSIYEVCEFLHDVVRIERLDVSFPYRVGVHNSCHGHRILGLGSPSEENIPHYSKLENLLRLIPDIALVTLERYDECCGFGGTFCVTEPDISVAMGQDRIADHLRSGVEVMTGADMSCLMHMEGIINREGKPLRVMHIVEILAESLEKSEP